MAVASTAGLVPITRSFLAKYYDKYPFKPINGDLAGVEESLRKETELIDAERRKSQVLDSAEVDLTQHFIACFSFIDEARKSSRGVLGIALPADLEEWTTKSEWLTIVVYVELISEKLFTP